MKKHPPSGVNKIEIYLAEKTHCCQTPADSKVNFITKEGALCVQIKPGSFIKLSVLMTFYFVTKFWSQCTICIDRSLLMTIRGKELYDEHKAK